mgnify:CR=1 FL=1
MDNNAKKDQSMLQSVNITTHLVSMKKTEVIKHLGKENSRLTP